MRQTTKRLAGLLAVLAVVVSLTACVRQKQYRYVNVPDRPSAIEPHPNEKYKLAFIEFKDNGEPHDPQQTDKAIELIKAERKGKDQSWAPSSVVLIYVHGWKNNANQAPPPKEKDVEKLKETLKEIATLLPELPDGSPTPLVGVYIGWRGKSLELPTALNWVSFWPRGIAAKHVGSNKLAKTLSKLVQAGNAWRGWPGISPKVVIVGHSFGSRVLEQAMKKENIQIGACNQLHTKGEPIRPPVDLVLFVNAATGSSVTRDIIGECKPLAGTDPNRIFVRHPEYDRGLCKNDEGPNAKSLLCRPYPMFVAISSRSDYATKFLLPLAAFRRSAAHTGGMNTHRVVELSPGQEIPEGNIFTFRSTKHKGDHFYAVMPKPGDPAQFWVMTVDKNVIADHGDIWNPDFRNMLFSLLAQTQAVPMKSNTYQRPAPKAKAREIK